MALNHTKTSNSEQKRQIFTFYVNDLMFGLNVENVLMLGQDVQSIQRLPIEERGFCGVTKFQGRVVPVLDFAHRIGLPSGIDSKSALLTALAQRENEHIEWLESLEQSIKTSSTFSKALNADECEFGKWYKSFTTRDETLKDLLTAFEEPHREIHALAEKLLSMTDKGEQAEAMQMLTHARQTTLHRLLRIFFRVKEQLNSSMRQVLLFITDDGKTPRYALIIDEINDVINYQQSEFQATDSGPLSVINQIQQLMDGIFIKDGLQDCLYFATDKLTDSDEIEAVIQQ